MSAIIAEKTWQLSLRSRGYRDEFCASHVVTDWMRKAGNGSCTTARLYPEREAAWQTEFSKGHELRARTVTGLERLEVLAFGGAGLIVLVFLCLAGAVYQDVIGRFVLLFGVFFLLAIIAGFGFSALAGRLRDPPRPEEPRKDEFALCSKPILLFDGNPDADLDPQYVDYKPPNQDDPRDPPDWDVRRAKCLERDENRCRLCGKPHGLQAHHVKPKSLDGSHSLQNLVTLCAKCHNKQKYYGHDLLVERAKAYATADGTPLLGSWLKSARYPSSNTRNERQPELARPFLRAEQLEMDFGGTRSLSGRTSFPSSTADLKG